MKTSRLLLHLSRKRKQNATAQARKPSALRGSIAALAASVLALGSAKAATYYWDGGDSTAAGNNATTGAGLGGSGTWDTAMLNWWDPLAPGADIPWPNLFDTAVFTGTMGANNVALTGTINAGSLIFSNPSAVNYVLSGGTLNLGLGMGATAPVISVLNNGFGSNRATIGSLITGTAGLAKTGDGALVLTNSANSYTGDTVINGGSVVITNQGQLGSSTNAISIGGLANTGNPGYSGGQLVLNGLGGGITTTREITISGRGPGATNASGGLVSVGYNTLAGHLTLGGPNSLGAVVATHGITTITGNVQIGNTGNTSTFYGNGNYIISGKVSGFEIAADRFSKAGQAVASTLWLQNATNDFGETIRIDSGTIRVSHGGALGVNNSSQAIDLNGGLLEVRTDANGGTFSTRNINQRANSTVFVSRDLAGSAINQTITFGNYAVSANNTNISFLGRDGYNTMVGTGTTVAIATGNPYTLNYDNSGTAALNGAGLLTLNHSLSFNDATGRNLTINARGDMVLTGNLLSPSGGNHNWFKGDTGTLTIQGTAGTFTGSFNITGTTVVTSIAALNTTATGVNAIQLNNGALDYRGTGETRTKLLNLSGTTGSGIILANQPSGTALVFNGNPVGGAGLGNKTFFLGGTSAPSIINEIGGVIANSIGNTTSLSKVGGNTWLYDPAAATYIAAVSVNSGATASGTNTNVFTVASAAGITVGQAVTGTNVPVGSVVTSINGTTITISNNIGTAIAIATPLTFGATSNFIGNVTVSGGILQVRPTAASGNGSDVINNTSQIIFAADALTGNQFAGGTFEYQGSAAGGTLTEQVGALTPTAGHGVVQVTANGGTPTLNFASLGTRTTGATLNFQPTGGPITFTAAAGTNGIIGGYATFGAAGTDFAASVAAAGAVTALTGQAALPASGSTATVNYQTTGTFATTAAESINSLKLSAAPTLTLGGILTITSGGVLFDNSGGAGTIQNNGTATNTLGASASEVIITTNGSAPGNLLTNSTGNALTVSAVISGGAGNLTKAGSGVLILSGANAFTGTTTINEGGIRLSGGGTLGGTNVNLAMRQGTVLDLNGVSVGTLASGGSGGLNIFNGAGTITNNAASGAAVLRVGNNGGAGVFSGLIRDGVTGATISLSKGGAGTISLTGVNTFTGPVTIGAGALAVTSIGNIGTASALGAGDSTSAATNAASLVFTGAATGSLQYTGSNASIYQTTATPSVTTNRLFTLAGNGIIDSSGQFGNSILNAGNVNNAALIFNNTTNAVAYGGAVGARTLTLQGNSLGDNEMGIQLTESGGYTLGLTKAGTGLWLVTNAANSYTLPTTITGGQLQVNANAANLPATSALRLAGGVLQTSGSFTRAIGTAAGQVAFTDAAGTAVNQSGGFAASGAKLTVNFGGANAGVQWGTGGIGNGTGTLILSSPTALADVEITNPIDFNGAIRTVQVDDNASTGLDFATLSGVLSSSTGTGGLTKTGGGNLILGDANTYNGATSHTAGALIVSSIGAAGATATSLGTNVGGGTLSIGNATTGTPFLLYVGPGETTTRGILLNSTTGTITIDSSGSGALNLTSITNSVAGAKILTLRGTNTDANMVTSVLADNGALSISKTDGGVWILNPTASNTFTGNIGVSQGSGLLGLTSNGIGSASNITLTNGGIFAYGGDLTTGTALILGNNSAAIFAGQNNITFTGSFSKQAGANDQTVSNNLENGKLLTLPSFASLEATANATRTINWRGYGSTTILGAITNGAATNLTRFDIRQSDSAVFTLAGDSKTPANGFTGGLLLGQGTLVLANAGALGPAANLILLDGGTLSATIPLTGANKIANQISLQGDQVTIAGSQSIDFGGIVDENGNRFIRNELTGGAMLTFSGTVNLTDSVTGGRTLTLRGASPITVSGVVSNGLGTTGGNLSYSGLNTLTITAPATATGALTVNRNTVILSGAGVTGGAWNAGSVTLNPIGILRLDNSAGNNVASGVLANRLSDTLTLTGNGGTLDIIGAPGGTNEVVGPLNLTSVQSFITLTDNSGGVGNNLTFASVAFANSGSALNLAGVPNLGTTNKVRFTAALASPAIINSILPRVFIGGGNLATYDTTNGVQAFTAYNTGNNFNTAAATDTLDLTASNSLTANRTVNAVRINGTGISIGGAGRTLTLTSGSLLNTGGNNSLDAGIVTFTNTPVIQVDAGTTLAVNSTLTGGTGSLNFAKALPGTLQINTPSFITGSHNLLRGVTTLNGGLNTFFPGQLLNINDSATLDLNGNTQLVGQLTDPGVLPEAGGLITSLAGSGTLVANSATSSTVATNINGNVNFAKAGTNTITLESVNTYTGVTTILGGTLQLQDDATILGTARININGGGLTLNNNSSLQRAVYNRVADTTPIFLRDGTLTFTGKVSDPATETFGVLTSAQGANSVTVTTGGTGTAGAFTSADVTFASLTRNAGTTVNFTGTNLGEVGNNARIVFTTPLATVAGGALGAWAIANSTDYAAYNAVDGVGVVGSGAFVGYESVFGTGRITNLVQLLANGGTALTSDTTTGMLRIGGAFTNDITFATGTTRLNLELGGLLRSNNNNATTIGTAALRGILTAGGTETSGTRELVVYNNQGTTTINSVIANNGFGNSVQLIKSGGGTLSLTANNTYTGGTTIVQGTVTLNGTGVVIPAGGVVLGGANLTQVTNAGQIDPSNVVTLRRSSVLTLVGNNTLDSLVFENNGGTGNPTVTVGASNTLTLSNSAPVTVTANMAPTLPTISLGTLALGAGSKTFDIQGPTVETYNASTTTFGTTLYSNIQAALNITSVITGAGPIIKSNTGILQLSAQNTYNGLNVTGGGILISGNSTPTNGGGGIASGPLGTGQVAMSAGTELLVDGTRTIGNDISFAGTPTFDSTANTVWTLTLNGQLTGAGFASPTPTVNVINPFLTVALLGNIPNIGTITSFNKTGAGTLVFNSTGYTGDFNATALGNPNQVQLLNDGDGTGQVQTIALGNVIFDPGIVPNIIVGRAGASLPFPLAQNKILAPASISNLGLGLTVTNNNGYGLQASDAVTVSGTPAFTVTNASASNVTQGLYLTGVIGGTGGFGKVGNGTLVLTNTGNNFTGTVNIRAGVISVSDNLQLGSGGGNIINLNPTAGNTATLRATDNITTTRTIQLGVTTDTRAIEVVAGKTLQLNSALNVASAVSASLAKNDLGTLILNANNPTWTGAVNINEGAILVNNPLLTTPLGTGTINVSPAAAVVGAALQLAGGVTVSNPLNLQGTGNALYGGINAQGQLDNVSGTNSYSGGINVANDSAIGARAGSTLNIPGLLTVAAKRLVFNSEGNINPTGGTSGNLFGFDKLGAGTLTVSTAAFGGVITTGGIKVEKGTLLLNGAGTTNSSGAVNIVYTGATMTLDNSAGAGGNVNNRLTARALTLQGGTFNLIGNNTTETAGAFVSDQGANTINLTGTGTNGLTFSGITQNAGSSLSVTGTFGTATNFLKFTANPALTPAGTGILNRVTVNGNELASYSAANGVVPFTNYSPATNILSATPTSTFRATTSTLNSLTNNQTLNALTITDNAAVGGLGGNPPSTLTLTSGTILANLSGSPTPGASLNVPIVAFGGAEGIIHVQSGQSLTVNSGLFGTGGLSKDLPGTLNLNVQQFVSGTHYINGGTVKLTSTGVTNPLLFNQGLAVNVGGTLDLNGRNQFVAGLSSATAGGNNGIDGGSVINSGAGQSTFTVNGNTNFAGIISGNIFLNKTGTGALNLQNAQTYTGGTLLTGGTTTLNDFGALPNTSQPININFATLSLANGNLSDVANRVSDTAPITLRGGQIAIAGRQQAASSETLGTITLADGFNAITTNAGGTNVNSLDVTAASLTRTGATSTIRFNATGQLGSSARLVFTTAPTLANNILGPWAIVDREYASYIPTLGIGALNGVGFAGYSGNSLLTNPSATDNVRLTAAGTTLLTGNTTVNTLTFAQQTTATVVDLGTNTLTAQGILFSQNTDNIDFSITNGSIAGPAGGGDLYLTHANFAGTGRTVTLNAPIVNNGGATRVIFTSGQVEGAGVGNTNVNAVNTNTGGTIINSGNVVLGAAGALGTGGLTINQGILTQTLGGVIPSSNALTMGGGSLLTLANQANTLAGITFNNAGGSAPTVTPTGTLTLTSGITVTTVNAGGIATIGTGTLDLNGGAGAFAINVGAAVINGVDVAPWQAGLSITSLIQNAPSGGITKSGAGLLQLSNASSTFAGGLNVTGGGLVIGASSVGPNLGDTVTSGPLGTGAVTIASGATLVSTGNFSVANNFTFLGDTALNGTQSLTLNGNTTLPSTWNVAVTSPGVIFTIGNVVGSTGSDVTNKSGLGTLSLGNYAGTINIAGGLIFLADGNQLGTPENVVLGSNINLTADTAITVNRSGGAPFARNKTIQQGNMTNNGSILALNNQSGYGLDFTGTTTLTGASHFSVAVATASNVVQGLTLSGVVSDTGAGGFDVVKSGPGTLALTNSGNTFGGAGKTIDVLNGILSASSDGALGNINNSVTLDIDGTTGTGFRATGTYTSGRTFILNQPNNAFEVTAGNVLTLTTPFTLSAVSNTLTKNDNGVLSIAANNSSWTGPVTVNAGAIRVESANALGNVANNVTVNALTGTAFQLANNVTYANPFTVALSAQTGINSGGLIQSVSGNNTFSGLITQPAAMSTSIGADAGATLNITGGINSLGANSITFAGAGNINLTTAGINNGTNLTKIGSGTFTISVANPSAAAAQAVNLFAGTTILTGAGSVGPTATSTGAVTVDVGSTLTLDNTGTAVSNRLGTTRPVTFRGGNFNLIGNGATAVTETFAVPTLSRGISVITVTAQPGAQANLLFTGSASNPAIAQNAAPSGASILFRGTNLGAAAGAGNATIRDTGGTSGFSFGGQTGGTGTNTKGLLPYALADATATGSGTSFATGDNTAGTAFTIANIRPLSASEYGTANTFAANQNVLLNSGTTNVAANTNPNSITIDSNANLTIANNILVSLSSGGILSRAGNTTSSISGGVINQTSGFSPLNVWTVGDLTISSTFNGGNGVANGNVGFVKAGAGTLTISSPTSTIAGLSGLSVNTMSGQLVINQGTLRLNGGKNTIMANNFVALDGGTLDLNGNSQQILGLFSDGVVNGAGGTITSSTGTGNLVINQDNAGRNFAGNITGNVKLTRSGQNTFTLYTDSNYTGSTVLNGGTTTLRDSAALSGTTGLDVSYATLNLDNNVGTTDLANRINDAAPVTLRGGTISLQGRALTASTETIGNVTLAEAGSQITSIVGGGTGINSADLTLTSLNRATGGGTVNFTAATGGQIGNASRILINTINGTSTAVAGVPVNNVFNGGGLTNNLIGGWATIGTSDFATYIPGLGVAALGANGAPAYSNPTSTPNTINVAAATDNISINVAVTGNVVNVTNDTTLNSLRIGNIAAQTVNIAAGKTLTLSSGGLLFFSTASQTIGSAVNQGNLTTTGPELFVYTQGNGLQLINSTITGSGVTLVKTGANTLNLAGTNTYGGGTTVNQGTLNVLATGNIPLATTPANGLIISNATVNLNAAGAIAAGNIVTINGNGTLNLFGNNTLAGVVFNNDGGTANPQIFTYSLATNALSNGVLTIGSSGLTATSSNVGTTSNIFGRVDFGSSPNTINVDSINVNGVNDVVPLQAGLALQGVIGSSGALTKSGAGVLGLNAQEIFSGALNVTAGGLRIGTSNGGSRFSALTLGANTRLDLANSSTTIGSLAGSGTVFSSSGTPTLTIGFDQTSSSFSGQFNRFNDAALNAVNVVKIGAGTQTLTGTGGTSTGTLTVSRGGVTYTDAGVHTLGTVTVNEGGTFTLDNTGTTNVNNRLANKALTLNGGDFQYLGRAGTASAETSTGILTLGPSASTINLTNGAGGTAFVTFASLAQQAGSTAIVSGTGLGTSTKLLFTTAPILSPVTTGILARIAVGTDFATYAAGTGVTAFTGYTTPTDINAAAGTATIKIDATTTTRDLNAARTINALDIIDNNVTIGSNGNLLPTQGETVTSGGVLVNGNAATISTPVLAFGGAEGIFRVNGSSLNITSRITGTAGITKTGAGSLTLSSPQSYTGQTALNLGTLTLAGGNNTLLVNPTATIPGVADLQVNGGVFDLNGNNQAVRTLLDSNTLAFIAGEITNSSATPATLTTAMNASSTFGGLISGNLGLTRSGNNTLTLVDAQTYTGPTIIRGGTLQLRDTGALTNTSSLTANYSTVNFDNSGLNPLANLNPTRIAATAPVTLQGGTITLNGGGSIDSTLTLNSVTILDGQSNVNVLPFVNSGSTALVTIGNLQRSTTNHSVVNFNGFTTNNSSGVTVLGGQGLSQNAEVILNQINGAAGPVSYVLAATTTANGATVTVPSTTGLTVGMAVNGANIPAGATIASIPSGTTFTLNSGTGVVAGTSVATNVNRGLTNNLIGGWAVANGNGFASYLTGAGVIGLGDSIQGNVAPAYDSTNISTATALQNVNDSTTARTITGAIAANSWRFALNAAFTDTIATASSLTLGVGIVMNSNTTANIVGTDTTSTLAGSGADLYIYTNQSTTNITAKITGGANLVKAGGSTLGLNPGFASNDYTGGTFVQSGTLSLGAAVGLIAVPGDLTLNNANVTMVTNAGQIAATSNVLINGGGTLTLVGSNTLNSLTFNSIGANGNPTVATATNLTLSSATPITSTNDNLSFTPTVSGTLLTLQDGATITTAGLSADDLIISAPIATVAATTPLVKTGAGSVVLTAASTFANGVNLNQGSIIFGASTTGTLPAITNGPVGVGTLALANGVAILSDGTARTISNPVSAAGNFTFGTPAAANSRANAGNALTLSNTVTLAAGAHNIEVNGLLMTGTITGKLTGGTNLTKSGPGTLVLSNTTNDFGGVIGNSIAVTGGTLQLGAAGVLPDLDAVLVSIGAALNLNGFNETIGSLAGGGLVTNQTVTPITLTTGGDNTDTTFSGIITNGTNALSLVKQGTGNFSLNGLNSYSGPTSINSGTVSINTVAPGATAQSLGTNTQVNLGVAATSPGTLNYTGGTGTLGKNISALGNGSNTITNSGTGPLTLAGTLTKNGTNLTLNAASNPINVTGTIVGALPNSDLTVSGGTTTVSSTGNTYNGATTVTTGATLAVTGSISGTTGVTNNGTLLLNSATNANNIVGNGTLTGNNGFKTTSGAASTTNYTGTGGSTLAVGNLNSGGVTNSFGTLTLSGSSILDFTTGNTGNNFIFNALEGSVSLMTGTAFALSTGATNLNVKGWNGTPFAIGAMADGGNFGDSQSRLLFTTDPGFGNGSLISGINFDGFGPGMQVQFGSMYEIVPVPEPATTALIGSVALCALIGYRERRRFTGIRSRLARK